MLARQSRRAFPTLARWARMNSGSNIKGPVPPTTDVGTAGSNADSGSSSKTSSSTLSQDATQTNKSESFSSLLKKTRASANPPQSHFENLVKQSGESVPAEEQTPEPTIRLDSPEAASISDSGLEAKKRETPGNETSNSIPPQLHNAVQIPSIVPSPELHFDVTDLSPSQQGILQELAASCTTQAELDELLSSPDLDHLLSLQRLQDLAETPEPIISSLPIPGKSVYSPHHHEPKHRIPVATITFKGHDSQALALFSHFAVHAASALGIPTSKVYALPKQRRLWTVLKSPFVYKKAQENFERITHSRGVKAWDADANIVNLWTSLLRTHAMPGVGMRVVRWTREEVGGGAKGVREVEGEVRGMLSRKQERIGDGERVRRLGEEILEQELAVAEREAKLQGAKAAETL